MCVCFFFHVGVIFFFCFFFYETDVRFNARFFFINILGGRNTNALTHLHKAHHVGILLTQYPTLITPAMSFFLCPCCPLRLTIRPSRARPPGVAAGNTRRAFGKNAYRLSIDLERAPMGSSVWVKSRRSSLRTPRSGGSTPDGRALG